MAVLVRVLWWEGTTLQILWMPLSPALSKYMSPQDPQAIVEAIFRRLQELITQYNPQERGRIYHELGNCYVHLSMFGRGIRTYRESFQYWDSEDVRAKLAILLVNLCGESACAEARRLVPASSSFAAKIETWIANMHAAIARHKRKIEFEQQGPAQKQLVGESQHILAVCERISRYASSTLPVLITGPTGSGKEVVARAIYRCSPRSERPFVKVNCAEGLETLFESMMFGHIKGAFTGALTNRKGHLEEAHGGTVFLDEVGELPLSLQPKLLRILEDKEFYPVGASRPTKADVRFIAATNRDLAVEVKEGKFREDLYSRLKGVEITLKPLEERLEDLLLLAKHFISKHELVLGGPPFSDYDIYCWIRLHVLTSKPESIRDFENSVRRAVTDQTLHRRGNYPVYPLVIGFPSFWINGLSNYTHKELALYDRIIALELCPKQKDAAKLLGMHPSTLSKLLMKNKATKKGKA